jgi:D-alanyl-D-alanine dipeptidase
MIYKMCDRKPMLSHLFRQIIITLTLICSVWGFSFKSSQAQQSNALYDIQTLAPNIHLDIRYAGASNFTGKIVSGYHAPKCLLHKSVANSLAKVEQGLNKDGYALVIYDCYRPTIAVDDFMRWAKDLENIATKSQYYPNLDKSTLVPVYIAEKSGHSKAATVDLGILDCKQTLCIALDMGTEFDFFGPESNTDYPILNNQQRINRELLVKVMKEQGFENYPMEWWHFTWKAGPIPDQAYDFPIQ